MSSNPQPPTGASSDFGTSSDALPDDGGLEDSIDITSIVKALNWLSVECAFGVYDRDDLPRLVDKVLSVIKGSIAAERQAGEREGRIDEVKRYHKQVLERPYSHLDAACQGFMERNRIFAVERLNELKAALAVEGKQSTAENQSPNTLED